MLNIVSLAIALAVTWFLWSGHTEFLILGFGVFSVLLVLHISRRMGTVDEEAVPVQLGLGIFTYWFWLLKEIVKSNIAVARIVLSRDLPISPSLTRVKAMQKTDLGKVIFANSITLTPGTVTLDIDDDVITVHGLTLDTVRDVESGEMNRRAASLG